MTASAAKPDVEILSPADADPFSLKDGQLVPPAALDGRAPIIAIADVTDEDGHDVGKDGTQRTICRGPAGHYHLIDVGPDGCRVVGAPITFAMASDIAAAILAGNQRVATAPGAINLLALAFLAALAEARRRKHRMSSGVSPAAASAPGAPPQPPLEPPGAAAVASQGGLPAGAQSRAQEGAAA